jgi:hypothetical protein
MIKRGKSCNHRLLASSVAAIIIGSGTFLFFLLVLLGSSSGFAKKPIRILTLIHSQKLSQNPTPSFVCSNIFFRLFSALPALVCKCKLPEVSTVPLVD